MEQVRYEKRFMAYVIDIAIALAIALALTSVFSFKMALGIMGYFNTLTVLTSTVFFLYTFIFYLCFNGLSIGRMIFNSRLVCKDNKRMPPVTIFMRALLQTLFPLAIMNVGYMLLYRTQESFFEKATNTMNIPWR